MPYKSTIWEHCPERVLVPGANADLTNVATTKVLESPFYVGDWLVDPGSNRLRLHDEEVKLEAKAMEVLVYLAGRAGEIVTREELERDVWAGKVVGYDSLTSTINKIRKAFQDNPRDPRYVETVSKKGYRLIAVVNLENHTQDDLSEPARNTGSGRPIKVTAIVVSFFVLVVIAVTGLVFNSIQSDEPVIRDITGPSIVVLAFSDLSQDTAQAYLSDGITEDITTALSKLSGLFVIARSSAMVYKDELFDARQIAEQLQVQYVLEGSVRRAGNELRVNASLVDGNSGFHLWSESYDRDMKDIFEVQDDITAKIVSALSIKLTEAEKQRTVSKYTVSIEAYDEFLQGQLEYARRTREDNLWARESFQQSIDIDPNFARAYSAMALTYSAEFRYGWHSNPKGSLEFAEKFAKKAVALDEQLPHAYWVLGFVYLQQRKYDLAIEFARKAIVLNPNHADSYATLGVSHIYDGDPSKGIRMMREAMRLSPQYPAAYASALGQGYFFMGQYADALIPLQDAVERNVNLLTSQVFLVATLSRLGKKEEASWVADQLHTLMPDFTVSKLSEMFPIKDPQNLRLLKDSLHDAGLQ